MAVAVASFPLWAFGLALIWPDARPILDGRDTLDAGAHANYVRNLFELTSFIATTGVLLTALWAFAFTRTQITEAKAARLAALYTSLEARWASAEMLDSKAGFGRLAAAYEAARTNAVAAKQAVPDRKQFVDDYLIALEGEDYRAYSSVMSLVDYLKYIGMLGKQKYLDIADIKYLVGTVCIEVYDMLSRHLLRIREQEQRRHERERIAGAPREYECLTWLVERFLEEFAS